MSKRGLDAPLAEQMDRLKKHMISRDKRRDQDRQQRTVKSSKDDPYQVTYVKSTGGVNLGPGAAAQAAVLSAAALEGPAPIRCELCQANFRNEAMLRQHEAGPSHKKALAKDKARREREAWMENPSAAANALQAAQWLNGDTKPGAKGSNYYSGRLQGRAFIPPADPAPLSKASTLSHADLIAQARKASEPISINGWIPPSLPAATMAGRSDRTSQAPAAPMTKTEPVEWDAANPEEGQWQGQQKEERPSDKEEEGNDDEDDGKEEHSGSRSGVIGLVAYADSGNGSGSDSEADSNQPKTHFDSFF